MLSIEVSSSKADAIPTIYKYIPQQVSVGTFDKSGKARKGGKRVPQNNMEKSDFFRGGKLEKEGTDKFWNVTLTCSSPSIQGYRHGVFGIRKE